MRKISSISSLLFLLAFTLFFASNSFAQDAKAGEKIYKANCTACHAWDKKLTGPALQGVTDRVQAGAYGDVDGWLKAWIKDNAKVRASGDAYGNQVYNANAQGAMTAFGFLSDAQLADLVAFLYVGPSKPAVDPNAAAAVATEVVEDSDSDLWMILIVIGIATLIIVIFSGVNRSMKNAANKKEGLPLEDGKSFWEATGNWIQSHKKLSSIIGFFLVLVLAKIGWDALLGIGVYQDYQPKQPIAFPHDLHAGKNEIDCKYCHSSARTSKTSGIPSANVCMNCHKAVTEGSRSGKTEIQKLYDYIGWNPDSMKYMTADGKMRNDTVIEWVKVHNLPDFVYFNHSQHVEVGKVACQKCHGEVEKMQEVKQFSELTMGWCVNCHRETEVNFAGNDYYIKIHEDAKKEFKHKKDFKFTVDKIGGLECAKCHY
ncbi:MAG: c-type cytochrome [Bacteroidetes bacterium]|nr:c-type cytochrome [Bacteroidota bacterium]